MVPNAKNYILSYLYLITAKICFLYSSRNTTLGFCHDTPLLLTPETLDLERQALLLVLARKIISEELFIIYRLVY